MSGRRRHALIVLLALGLGLWELPFASLMADDFIQLGVLEGVSPLPGIGPLELYTLSDSSPQRIQALKDVGAMPWFFDPGFRMAFFRPLSSASLVLDHALFGLHPVGYRVHVTLWFLLLVATLGGLYGLVAGRIATLALLLFTLSGMHAVFCWTATRHVVIAAALGLVALYGHVRWREEGWRPGRALALAGVVAALGASEAGMALVAYLLAYEALGAPGSAWSRVRASLPVVGVSVAYVLMYRHLGLGASAGSDYLDPFRDPATYVTQLPGRLLVIVGGMLSGGNDLWVIRQDLRPTLIVASGVVVLLGGVLLRAVWSTASTSERRATRWLVAGAVLAAVPFAGTPIGARCMVIPWIGGSVAVALVLERWWTTLRQRPGMRYRVMGGLCWGLVAFHLVLAPVERLAVPFLLRKLMFQNLADAVGAPDLGGEPVAGRTVVILNAPNFLVGQYAFFFRRLYRLPMPAAWRVLSWARGAHRFRRIAADSIEMELMGGELHAPHLARGDVVEVAGMRATVVDVGRDGPTRVVFRFDRSLDDPTMVLLIWNDGRVQHVATPAIGEALDVPPKTTRLEIAERAAT